MSAELHIVGDGNSEVRLIIGDADEQYAGSGDVAAISIHDDIEDRGYELNLAVEEIELIIGELQRRLPKPELNNALRFYPNTITTSPTYDWKVNCGCLR